MFNCTFAARPVPGGPAATGITVAWPGHDCDCAQAPFRLVACRAVDVVTCSRLVVSNLNATHWQGPWPRACSAVGNPCIVRKWLMAWSIQVQLAKYGSLQRQELWRGWSRLWHATWPVTGITGKKLSKFTRKLTRNYRLPHRAAACTPLTNKLLYNMLSRSCTNITVSGFAGTAVGF